MVVTVQSRKRVFPDSHKRLLQPKVECLSIIDATVLHFAKTACIWFYDGSIEPNRLISSLRRTLNAYPQWAGQLRFAEYNPDAGHNHRQGRLELSYSSLSDPGVECIFATADSPMSSVLPPDEMTKHWDVTHVNYRDFLDTQTQFALYDSKECHGLPSMKIQLTTFKAGGIAIAVSIVHSLADAAALLTFMKHWAATNLALSSSKPIPVPKALFKPSLIGAAAIRDTVAKFDGEAVAALLHEIYFELGGRRRWNCFLGDYHTTVTSWVGIGIREVVFEEGKKVRWAEVLLPPCDGVVVVGEGGGGESGVKGEHGREQEWWSKGVNLNVYLRRDVMEKLMEDEALRENAEKGN